MNDGREEGRAVLVRGHPTIDTQPCAFGHYEVRKTDLWILNADGLKHWKAHRVCMRCDPISTGQWRILPGGGIDFGGGSV